MILGTAGHIDHGKTALVRALTGVDTDRLPEEKRRGITIDLGFAPLELESFGSIGIVDVPGHEAFIRTMLAGASGIDIALLVVAADEGVMPQTREHLEIVSLLAIPKLVVALTKSDLVDEEWLSVARDDVKDLLHDTPYELSEVIAVSATAGVGLDDLKNAIVRAAKACDANRRADDLFRMPVDRAFTIKGTGTVVTGTVWSGTLDRRSQVTVFPPGIRSRVRAIQHHNASVSSAIPGERIALALGDVELSQVKRGSVVVAGDGWTSTTRAQAVVRIDTDTRDIGPRTRLRFHFGTADVGARLARARPIADATTGEFTATVVLEEPLLLRAGDRFVLRLPSPEVTIGGGIIIDPLASKRAHARNASGSSERLKKIVDDVGVDGVPMDVIPIRVGVTPDEASRLAADFVNVDGRLYSPAVIEALEMQLEIAISTHVENFPLDAGVQLEKLRSSVRARDDVVDFVLARLTDKGRIEVQQSVAKPKGWSGKLSDRLRNTATAVMHEICTRSTEPPAVSELETSFGGDVPVLLRYLERSGELVRVSDDRYYSPSAVEEMVRKLRSSLERGRVYAPAEIREVLGLSRKYLIPFLEFCDASGVTNRQADGRSIGEGVAFRRL